MKLVTVYSSLSILFAACTQSPQNISSKHTLVPPISIDTTEEIRPDPVQIRKELIDSYDEILVNDSFFFIGDRLFQTVLKHYCTYDSALIVPAQYNFDTKTDFRTHNFMSELLVIGETDTIFKKQIGKELFEPILYPELINHGMLLFPSLHFENDSIAVRYSISIPVTDVGVPAEIKFDTSGHFRIYQ